MTEAAEWDAGIRKAYEHKRFPEAPPKYRGLTYAWREREEADSEHGWRNSVYYFWWEYMRRNERYRLIHEVLNSADNSDLRKVHSDTITAQEVVLYAHFGNVFEQDFHAWWRAHYRLFSDEVAVHIRVLEGRDTDGRELCSFSYDEVDKLTIGEVVKRAQGFFGDNNCIVVQHSNSRAKYRPAQRYVLPVLQSYLDVWDMHKANPDMALEDIADKLNISYSNDEFMKGIEEITADGSFNADLLKIVRRKKRLVVQRYLRIAGQYIENVMQGQFPLRNKR